MKTLFLSFLVAITALGQTSARRLTGVTPGSYTAANITVLVDGTISVAANGGAGGTVTTISGVNVNGILFSIANPTTTPAITISLGDIFPKNIFVTNNYSFYSDNTTYLSLPSAGQIDITSGGKPFQSFTANGHHIVGTNLDNGTGAQLQVYAANSPAIIDLTGFGVAGSMYARLYGGTEAAITPSTASQVFRAGLRINDTAGSKTDFLAGNLEVTPGTTMSSSDHSSKIALWATKSGTTTRVEEFTLDTSADANVQLGHLKLNVAGKGLIVKSGTNAKLNSTGALTAGVATVANTSITTSSRVFFTLKTLGGTVGIAPYVSSISAGTNFNVTATATDTSDYYYFIVESQ